MHARASDRGHIKEGARALAGAARPDAAAGSRVYASLPLTGPPSFLGREILRGVQLALERAERRDVALVALDCFGERPGERALANARRAAADPQALAYVGELHPALVRATAPILGAAGLLQVAPLGTVAGLTGETLVWLSPHERVGARAVAAWLVEAGVGELLVVYEQGYGGEVAAMCVEAARERELVAHMTAVGSGRARRRRLGEAQAVLYVAGGVGPRLVELWRELHAAKPDLWLLAHLASGPHWLPRKLEPAAAARSRFFVPQRATPGFYGFEAMDLILDAIARGRDGRAAVVQAARATSERNSILGRYSIDADGYTTSEAYGRLVVVEGPTLGWELPPREPASVKAPPESRVYASLPLGGPVGWLGRNVLRGAQLALERAERSDVELVVLDCSGEDPIARAVANAHRATADGQALAYLGDYNSPQVHATAPILGAAGLLQVPPLATSIALSGETLVRLTAHDGAGARAVAEWLVEAGVEKVLVVHDEGYGRAVAVMCLEAARERGLLVRLRPLWGRGERPAEDLGEAQAVVYVGDVAGAGALALLRELHAARPELWLLGRVDLVDPRIAGELEPSIAARSRFFVPLRTAYPFYGFEAMDFILDAIARGGEDRASVVRAARSTSERNSILGRYSIDANGYTTSEAYGRRMIVDGQLVWDVAAPGLPSEFTLAR